MESHNLDDEQAVPLDVFDPSEDGHAPHSLAEVVEAGREAIEALARFEEALKGCMTPLNLARVIDEIKRQASELSGTVKSVSSARKIIEHDRPIARTMSYQDKPWFEPGYGMMCLSPKQLWRGRQRASEVMPSELTTYREAITTAGWAIPNFILQERKAKERARRASEKAARLQEERKRKEPLLQELLEDMLTRPCEKCEAPAGEYCMTANGTRAEVLHVARRDASPLMRKHIALFSEVKQPPEFVPHRDYHRAKKEALEEAAETLARSFTPRYE